MTTKKKTPARRASATNVYFRNAADLRKVRAAAKARDMSVSAFVRRAALEVADEMEKKRGKKAAA